MTRTQTHQLAVSRASAAFVLRAASIPRSIMGDTQRPAAAAVEAKEDNAPPRGGGGAWRLYVVEQCRGQPGGLPDIAALAKKYRSLPPSEIARLREGGGEASSRHRAGASAFGMGTREEERAGARAAREARRKIFAERIRAIILAPGLDPVAQLAVMPSSALQLRGDFGEADVGRLRGLAAYMSMAIACEHAERSHVLRKHGAAGSSWLTPQVPELIAPAARLLEQESAIVPCCVPELRHAEWCMPKLKEAAVKLASAQRSNQQGIVEFHHALLADWDTKHRVVQADAVAKLPKKKRSPTSKCFEVGMCFCSPRGAALRRLGSNVSRTLRSFFAKGKSGRDYMVSGSIAILFMGEPLGPLSTYAF